jgi:hypothetical protein
VQDALPIVIVAVVVVAGLVGLAATMLSRTPYERIGESDLSFEGVDSRVNDGSIRDEEIAQMRAALARRTPDPRRTGSLPAMPALRRFDVDELLTRPGTYFNPETEIVLIVDDSAHVDLELIEDEEDDGAEWILLGDDPAIDEHKRDELVEAFETRRARSSAPDDPDDDEDVEDEDELEPDPDREDEY